MQSARRSFARGISELPSPGAFLEGVGSALCQVRPDVRLSVQPLRRSSWQSCFRELRIAPSLVAKETWGTWWMRHILGKGSLPSSLVHGSAFRQGSGYTPGMLQQFIPQVTREPAPLEVFTGCGNRQLCSKGTLDFSSSESQ